MPEPGPAQRALREVLLALVPGILALAYWHGAAFLLHIVLALACCFALESLTARLSGQAARAAALDGSAAITAVLLALSLPSHGPWWLVPIACAVAILVGKHSGGARHKTFNPAMLGVACVLLAFPLQVSQGWYDALSSATPLESLRGGLQHERTVREIAGSASFAAQAMAGQITALAWLAGGLFLLWRRRIRWQIPTAVLAGLLLPALAAWLVDPDRYASPLFHAWAGASMLVAFFIATEPTTAPVTPRARIAYGAAIGLLAWLLRGRGYPEGFAFAVLVVNACTPLLARTASARLARGMTAPLLALGIAISLGLLQDTLADRNVSGGGLAGVLPAQAYDNDPLAEARETAVGTRYLARKSGRPVAAIYRTQAPGYGGEIELLVAAHANGGLAGLRVLSHHETPSFAQPYVGTDRSWLGKPGADAWSGASVTPRAIAGAVRRVLDYHSAHRQDLLVP